jgi:Zn-dependent oligopeptidase
MAEHRVEIEAIAAGPWPPTFTDTIDALERAGGRLHLAERLLTDTSGSRSTPAVRALEAEMLPRLAAHRDAVELCLRRHPDPHVRVGPLEPWGSTSTGRPTARPPC